MKYLISALLFFATPALAENGGVVGAVAGALAQAMDTGGDDD